MKNVKWLTGLELVDYDYKGYWQQQSWSDTALVKLSSRIDVPGDRELITTPQYTMKGIAFHGNNQIHMLEVRPESNLEKKPLLPKLIPEQVMNGSFLNPGNTPSWPEPRMSTADAINQAGEVVELHAITVNVGYCMVIRMAYRSGAHQARSTPLPMRHVQRKADMGRGLNLVCHPWPRHDRGPDNSRRGHNLPDSASDRWKGHYQTTTL